ncbi:hypothetical protein S83_063007 [Arachis hypogaea]
MAKLEAKLGMLVDSVEIFNLLIYSHSTNQMTVVEAYVGRNKLHQPDDSSNLNPEVLSLINEGIAQNTTGNVFVPKEGGEAEISGSPTEKAILSWAVKLNSYILHLGGLWSTYTLERRALDHEGFVAKGPNMNVAFVTKEKELIMPHFDKILSGCTAKRVLTLAEKLLSKGKLRGIRMKHVTVEEGKSSAEMMLIGSGVLVCPVVQWDEQVIGDGKEGRILKALFNLIVEDMESAPPTVRIPVPY